MLSNTAAKKGIKRILSGVRRAITLAVLSVAVLSVTALSLTGCSGSVGAYNINTRTVMTIGGQKVSYDIYKHFYYAGMTQLGGESVDWTKQENLDDLKLEVEAGLKRIYALKLLCDKYGIELTSDDRKEVDAIMQDYIDEQDGESGYRLWLSENRISGNAFREQIERVYYYDVYLRELLFTGFDDVIKMDDATVKKDIEENFYRYTQIYISCEDEDDYSEYRKDIEAALEELKAGKEFSEVRREYSDWMVNVELGVYCAKGQKLPEMEEAALALGMGEYSGVVESSEGYHIIMRLPMEDSYIEENLDDLGYVSANRRYNVLLDETAAGLAVEYSEYYNTLTFEQLISLEYPK